MADQTVRIENMPKTADSGSVERVAFDLMLLIRSSNRGTATSKEEILRLYRECLHLVRHGFAEDE